MSTVPEKYENSNATNAPHSDAPHSDAPRRARPARSENRKKAGAPMPGVPMPGIPRPGILTHAYRQAPWRLQTQRLMIMLIIAILGASVLWIMLSVTVEAGVAGLEIQSMENEQHKLRRKIASQRTEYAILTSADRMTRQAEAMGFEVIQPENISYIVVPAYTGRKSLLTISPSNQLQESHFLIKPAYTQSLSEWLGGSQAEFPFHNLVESAPIENFPDGETKP